MPKLIPRRRPADEGDPIADAIVNGSPTPIKLLSQAEALALMERPERYATEALPEGLWATVNRWPNGAEVWREWIRKVWQATDERTTRILERKDQT